MEKIFQKPKAIETVLAFITNTEIGTRPGEKEDDDEKIDLYDRENLD